jgi:hypothetical protein
MELAWGPVVKQSTVGPIIGYGFDELKPGLRVSLRVVSSDKPKNPIASSAPRTVSGHGDVRVWVSLPSEVHCDRRLRLVLYDADRPAKKLWVGEYVTAGTPICELSPS